MAESFTISAFTENSPGVLQRITVLFTRRRVNIESLTVSETERKGVSRFTIVVNADESTVEKIVKQIRRIIEVQDAYFCENKDLIYKEIAFFKVNTADPKNRSEIEEHARRYGAQVVHADSSHLVVEKTGEEDDVNSLFLLLEPFGIKEFVRSGRIAMLKKERALLDLPIEEEQGSRGDM